MTLYSSPLKGITWAQSLQMEGSGVLYMPKPYLKFFPLSILLKEIYVGSKDYILIVF